jgi:hypothetical protein
MILEAIQQGLQSIPELSVSLRGSGKARFLYVRSISRAVEVYLEAEGIMIEFWDKADEECEDAPINRKLVGSESEALVEVKEWLLAGGREG